jgi:thioredoxin reductase
VRDGEVRHASRQEGYFELELADGTRETSRRVLLATGMQYRRPTLPGVAERWGRSVFHCPFCHGWEVRDRALAVFGAEPLGEMRALLLREWSDDVTLLTNGPANLDAAAVERLRRAGVVVDERPVARLRGAGTTLAAVVFADGSERACEGLMVAAPLHQRHALAAALGVELADPNQMAFDAVAVDDMYGTNVPGVFAAGDTIGVMPSVANSVAAGSSAAAAIVRSLVFERHGLGAS